MTRRLWVLAAVALALYVAAALLAGLRDTDDAASVMAISAALGIGGLVAALRLPARKVCREATDRAGTDLSAADAQAILADSFTRLFEVAEGRRAAMVEAGWSPLIAEAMAATLYGRLLESTLRSP